MGRVPLIVRDEETNAAPTNQSDAWRAPTTMERFRNAFFRAEGSAARRVGGVGPGLRAAIPRRRRAHRWARFAAAAGQRARRPRESRGCARNLGFREGDVRA